MTSRFDPWKLFIAAMLAVLCAAVAVFIVYAVETDRMAADWADSCRRAGGHPVRASGTFLCLAPGAELHP